MRHYKLSSIPQNLIAGAVSLLATAGLIAVLALPSGEVLARAMAKNASTLASTNRDASARGPAVAAQAQAPAPVLQLPRVVIRASRSTVQAKHTPGNAVAQART